jgi:peptidoglycan/LPS O-acetylase OafA/YrhL
MIFFVISGFLITSLLLKEDRVNLSRFYFRRTVRIFPPFYAYLTFIVLLKLAGVLQSSSYNLFAAFSYTTNFCFRCAEEGSWFTGHTWSLAIEEQFYLLWPPVLWLIGRTRSLWVAIGVLCLCPLIRLIIALTDPGSSSEFFTFSTVADSLAVGCVLASVRPRLHENKLYSFLMESKIVVVAPVMALLVVWLGDVMTLPAKPIYVLVAVSLQNVCVAITLDWCISHPDGAIGRFLNARAIVFLGTISYSLYLWQQPFLFSGLDGPIWNFPLNVAFIGIATLGSYYLVEKPSLKLRERLDEWWSRSRAKRGLDRSFLRETPDDMKSEGSVVGITNPA